jgi:hypothetical protein
MRRQESASGQDQLKRSASELRVPTGQLKAVRSADNPIEGERHWPVGDLEATGPAHDEAGFATACGDGDRRQLRGSHEGRWAAVL